MNRTLIRVLDELNKLLAILLIVICTVAGFAIVGQSDGSGILGAIVGLLLGILVAALICGLLATFLEIEKHLRTIASGKPHEQPTQ